MGALVYCHLRTKLLFDLLFYKTRQQARSFDFHKQDGIPRQIHLKGTAMVLEVYPVQVQVISAVDSRLWWRWKQWEGEEEEQVEARENKNEDKLEKPYCMSMAGWIYEQERTQNIIYIRNCLAGFKNWRFPGNPPNLVIEISKNLHYLHVLTFSDSWINQICLIALLEKVFTKKEKIKFSP